MIMVKQEATTTATPPIPTACGNCGVEERRLLHHVRHRGIFRRLCTSCVLRLHPQSFCPSCFVVYDRSPPPSNDAVTCFKCYSSSHSHCVGSNASNTYVCPPCTNPNIPIFSPKKGDGEGNESCRAIDKKAARVLIAAARIAAVSMSKAAVAAKAEAERRAKEAAFTRKRAREALEHVAFLVAKEKLKRKELPAEVSGSGNVAAQEKNYKGGTATANSGVVAAAAMKVEQNRIQRGVVVDRVDSSSEVLAALNAVELREKERSHEFKAAQNAVSGPPSNGASMVVEDNERLRVSPVSSIGAPYVHNHGAVNENERSGHLGHLQNHSAPGGKMNTGLLSVPPVGVQPQHMQNNLGRDEIIGSQQ